MTATRRLRIEEQLQTAETDTTKRLAPDGAGGVEWSTGGGGGGDCDHQHTHDRFVAAGATPETFTLSETPLFDEVQVFVQGVLADPDDVALAGSDVSVDTSAADVVVIFYAAECEDDVFKRVDVSVDFIDVPNDGDQITIYTPAAGEKVFVAMREDTLIAISGGGISGGSDFIAFGRAAAADCYQAFLGTDIVSNLTEDAFAAAGSGSRYASGGANVYLAGDYCPDTTAITAKAIYNGHGPATAGHADLILLIAKAV